jgi:hypothetical protein
MGPVARYVCRDSEPDRSTSKGMRQKTTGRCGTVPPAIFGFEEHMAILYEYCLDSARK